MNKTAAQPGTIERYLARLGPKDRAALEKLRKDIRDAVECISYGIPGFRLDGRYLVGFGASAKHLSFYPGAPVQNSALLLKGYSTSRGTVRFPAAEPLPSTLVRKLVKAKIAQLNARS